MSWMRKVVFFVDHQAELLVQINGNRSSSVAFGVLTADQLTLDKKLTINIFQLSNVENTSGQRDSSYLQTSTVVFPHSRSIMIGAATNEGEIGEIPRKTNTTADHNI